MSELGPFKLWTKSLDTRGYGQINVRRGGRRTTVRAHRIAYEKAFGSFDPSLHVLHRCDNPACVNPNHLFLGTHADNMRDCALKGRSYGGPRKLTIAEARKAWMLYWSFGMSQEKIAEFFDLHPSTISVLVNGLTWRCAWR